MKPIRTLAGVIYMADEVNEHLAAVGASTQGLLNRVAELEKRPDLCEMEPPDVSHDLSNGVVCIGCWNELAYRAGKQAVALESMSDRIAELASALRELLQDTQHVNHNCGDTSDRCPVLRAREVLNELMESVTK